MSVQARQQHGMPSWNELTTSDVTGAKAFYGKLLDWTLEDVDANGMDYTVVKAGDQEIGGIMAPPPNAGELPPSWGAYITVDDLDSRVARVRELGGKVLVEPTGIPDVGRFALIADPQGAILNLITWNKEE